MTNKDKQNERDGADAQGPYATGPYYEGCGIISEDMRRRIDSGEFRPGIRQVEQQKQPVDNSKKDADRPAEVKPGPVSYDEFGVK